MQIYTNAPFGPRIFLQGGWVGGTMQIPTARGRGSVCKFMQIGAESSLASVDGAPGGLLMTCKCMRGGRGLANAPGRGVGAAGPAAANHCI